MDAVMELEIGPGPAPGAYLVRVLRSLVGGDPSEVIHLDVDALVDRRPALEASVLASSVSARRILPEAEAAVQDVGTRLFEATFTGTVAIAYRASLAVASEHGAKGVQLVLRLTAPGLAALPWETMYDSETLTYLCRSEPLVRRVSAPYTPDALAITPPLRVLGMVASPRGLPTLDVTAERERLEHAMRRHIASGRVELDWLEDVSWDGLHGKLLDGEWHVLHFIGHGDYDTETDEGVLAFVDPNGRAEYIRASNLAVLLREAEPAPRLVVLNSCESGTASATDLFSGTAAALAHSGIHAVAAMQFSISDSAALAFADGFYDALAHGRGIDEAVRSGRIRILRIGQRTLEWVTPVLYLRGEDTRVFEISPLSMEKATTGLMVTPGLPSTPPPHEVRADAPARVEPRGPTAPPAEDTPPAPQSTPTPPTPSGPMPVPAGTGGREQPKRRWVRWLVGLGIAMLVVAGAVWALWSTRLSGATQVTIPMGEPGVVNTGVSCGQGDLLRIEVTGEAWYDQSAESRVTADGLTDGSFPENRILTTANTASVIGRSADGSGLFAVGTGGRWGCTGAPHTIELLINDTVLDDNRGEFHAAIWVNHTNR